MNKYVKGFLIFVFVFAVLFAVGCAKSALEEEKARTQSNTGWGVPAVEYADVDYAYDEGYAERVYEIEESYGGAEPAMYYKGYMPPYDDGHYGDGEDIDDSVQIIRSGSMSLEVEDYFIAEQKVSAFAKKYGGYVSSSYANTYDERKSGSVTIRVPELHFDAVIAELSLIGEVKSKNINGQDVTEQYIDLQARVNNSKAQELRLVEMYANATDVDEMMRVERELSRVRESIERTEGQLRYLKNRVAMSSLTVTLSEPLPVVKEWGIWTAIKNALNHSLATLRWMIEFFGVLLPLLLVGGLVWWIVRLVRRGRRVKRR